MLDTFFGLRHDTFGGGDDQNNNVGDLGPTRTHVTESGMTRSVNKSNPLNLVSANVLGDSTTFSLDHIS